MAMTMLLRIEFQESGGGGEDPGGESARRLQRSSDTGWCSCYHFDFDEF